MIYFLIPVYNEEGNIPGLSENLLNILPEEDITWVFSDDGSKDRSVELIKQYFPKENTVVLGDGLNHGPGIAFNNGFSWIVRNSNGKDDVIITLEADNTSDHTLIPKMLTINRLGFDLVLASVYAQGGGFQKTSFLRKLLSASANIVMRSFFDLHVQTLSSFYRVYTVASVKRVSERYDGIINEAGFLCMIELLMKCIHTGSKVIEVPTMLLSERRKGKSKMKVFKTAMSYIRFLLFKKIR